MKPPLPRAAPAAPPELPPLKSRAGPLLFLAAIFMVSFLSRIILAPLLVFLEADLQLSHEEAGELFGFISLGVSASLMGSGFVASRLNHRRTIVLSTVLIGVMLLITSLTTTAAAMKVCLVLLGTGAGLYFPSGIATVASLVRPKDLGKAIAIHELAPNASFVLAPLLAEAFTRVAHWRVLLASFGVLALFMAAAFARLGRGGDFPGEEPRPAVLAQLVKRPSFWIMVVLLALAVGAGFGIYTMIPLYLTVDRGFSREWANTLTALSRVGGVAMALAAGWLVDRLGIKRAIAVFSAATGLATVFLGWAPDAWVAAAVFLQPSVSVCFFPAGFAAISRIVPPSRRNVAVSFTSPLAIVLGAGGVPKLLGWLGDRDAFSSGFVILGVLVLLSAVLPFFLSFEGEEPPPGPRPGKPE